MSYGWLIRILLSCCLALFAAVPALAAEEPDAAPPSTVVASAEVREPITMERLHVCMDETARAMGLQEQQQPVIVVLQLSAADAQRLHMTRNRVLTNRGADLASRNGMGMYYELWLVPSGSTIADLALGVATVYENHYGVTQTDQERAKVVNRVLAFLGRTVSVKSLREAKNRDR